MKKLKSIAETAAFGAVLAMALAADALVGLILR